MTYTLPQAVRDGLEQARKQAMHRGARLCVHDGDDVYRIRRIWATGLAVDAAHADRLRGRVEIYDGSRHLYQCLLESGRVEGEEIIFDFKWLNPVAARAPVDFELTDFQPAGLIGRS